MSLPLREASDESLVRLKEFLGLDDHNYRLLFAFLINALKPQGPYFILLVEGEQGSGKSFSARSLSGSSIPMKRSAFVFRTSHRI